ncbi:MAG TPA: tyrosine-protein phosphatase [Micromonosporaceae bacterium]
MDPINTLGLANAANARDLGGHVTNDGRRLRTGVLFRANGVHRLSPADIAVLAGLKLACVIDFREPAEVLRLGADKLPPGPRSVALPVLDPAHHVDIFALIGEVVKGNAEPSTLDFLRDEAPGGGAATMMAELYRRFVTTPMSRAAFAEALRLVSSPEDLPLLFHCTAGKDRTGWLAATVLSALDVDRDAIMADYLRTNDLSTGTTQFVLDTLDGKIPDPTVILPLIEARRSYLEAAFAEAERAYGGMAGYLRDGLGADEAMLDSLRANLLE